MTTMMRPEAPAPKRLDEISALLPSVQPGVPKGWTIFLDGKVVDANHLRIVNPKVGRVEYGLNPKGWDQILIRPQWGAAVVMYSIIKGKLFVALIKESRFNFPEGIVWDLPGGFAEIQDQSVAQTAQRELEEETGVAIPTLPVQLPGELLNCNRAFFDTREGGDLLFAYQFPVEALKKDGTTTYTVHKKKKAASAKTGAQNVDGRTKLVKMMDTVVFFPWHYVAQKSDVFCRAGVMGLLLHLMEEGVLTLTFSKS